MQRHMQRVQKDLEALKKRLTEQEYVMRRSERIAILEKEVAWYKEESLIQSKIINDLKEENARRRNEAEEANMQIAEMEVVLTKFQRK